MLDKQKGKMSIVEVFGQSMRPYLTNGDLLLVQEFSQQEGIKPGQIYLLDIEQDPYPTLHRLVPCGSDLLFKGDNELFFDNEVYSQIEVKGVVTHRVLQQDRVLKKVRLDHFLTGHQSIARLSSYMHKKNPLYRLLLLPYKILLFLQRQLENFMFK